MKTAQELSGDQRVLLRLVLDHHEDLTEVELKAFSAMLHRLNDAARIGVPKSLSFKQLSWLNDVAKRLDVVEPSANLVSRGLVPRGAEVPTPVVLLNRPLKPPGR